MYLANLFKKLNVCPLESTPLSVPPSLRYLQSLPPRPRKSCLSFISVPQGSYYCPPSVSPITLLTKAHRSPVAMAAAPAVLLLQQRKLNTHVAHVTSALAGA